MSTSAVRSRAESDPEAEWPEAFGRLRWWFEESPMAFTASLALFLVTCGFCWILTVRPLRADSPMTSVALQAVQSDWTANDESNSSSRSTSIEQLAAAGEKIERAEMEKVQFPELPPVDPALKVEELLGNQAETDKQIKETEQTL